MLRCHNLYGRLDYFAYYSCSAPIIWLYSALDWVDNIHSLHWQWAWQQNSLQLLKYKWTLCEMLLCGEEILGAVVHQEKNILPGNLLTFLCQSQKTHKKEIRAYSMMAAKQSWLIDWKRATQPRSAKPPLICRLAEVRSVYCCKSSWNGMIWVELYCSNWLVNSCSCLCHSQCWSWEQRPQW